MNSFQVQGYVDEQHRLSANVPGSIPPGPVSIWIAPAQFVEDDAGDAWSTGVAREWASELEDTRQDIYTLEDGTALDES